MQSNTSARAALRDWYHFRAVRSVLSEEKKLSITELSHTFPDRLMLQVTPSAPRSRFAAILGGFNRSSQRSQSERRDDEEEKSGDLTKRGVVCYDHRVDR